MTSQIFQWRGKHAAELFLGPVGAAGTKQNHVRNRKRLAEPPSGTQTRGRTFFLTRTRGLCDRRAFPGTLPAEEAHLDRQVRVLDQIVRVNDVEGCVRAMAEDPGPRRVSGAAQRPY